MGKDIFGESPKTVVLYEPDQRRFEWYQQAFSEYTVPILKDWAIGFYSVVKDVNVKIEGAGRGSRIKEIIDIYLQKKGYVNKDILILFLSIFAADMRNLEHYVNSLSDDVLKIMQLVVRNYVVSNTTLVKVTGKNWYTKSGYYSSSYVKSPELVWLKCISGNPRTIDYSYEHYFYMDAWILAMFIPFFKKREEIIIEPLPVLPQLPAGPLKVFCSDPQILSTLPVLEGLSKQGSLDMNGSRKLPISTLKKLAGLLKLSEFYPGETKQVQFLRASLVIPVYSNFFRKVKNLLNTPEAMLKKVFGELILSDPAFLVPLLLPHLVGLRGNYLRQNFRGRVVRDFLYFMLSVGDQMKTKEWICFDQAVNNYMQTGQAITLFTCYSLDNVEFSNRLHDCFVYMDRSFEDISISFYKAFFFMLAGFGLAEIAYTDYDEAAPSLFSSLRYYRLTDLGRYVFGMTKSYVMPGAENKESLFELDDKNLIIRSLKEDNPYEALLEAMAEPIGRKRYKITHASLLNSCNTQKDVANKVEFFKHFISDKLPGVWDDFLKSLVKRCKPLYEVPRSKYLIYRLDPSNRELLQLLSTDPVIRQYTLRAEGHLLLVEEEQLNKVVTRLKYFGYLL